MSEPGSRFSDGSLFTSGSHCSRHLQAVATLDVENHDCVSSKFLGRILGTLQENACCRGKSFGQSQPANQIRGSSTRLHGFSPDVRCYVRPLPLYHCLFSLPLAHCWEIRVKTLHSCCSHSTSKLPFHCAATQCCVALSSPLEHTANYVHCWRSCLDVATALKHPKHHY